MARWLNKIYILKYHHTLPLCRAMFFVICHNLNFVKLTLMVKPGEGGGGGDRVGRWCYVATSARDNLDNSKAMSGCV